ncbi:hypothetical protein HMPREF9413_3233 [Paenibacillus sp. HGF7]|nr:hypothetical protein HMPREF9413_3233 [Paenibacillus sp. HGF7]
MRNLPDPLSRKLYKPFHLFRLGIFEAAALFNGAVSGSGAKHGFFARLHPQLR